MRIKKLTTITRNNWKLQKFLCVGNDLCIYKKAQRFSERYKNRNVQRKELGCEIQRDAANQQKKRSVEKSREWREMGVLDDYV